MKLFNFICLLVLLPYFGISQTNLFAGASLNSDVTSNAIVQVEDNARWVKMQLTYLSDLQLKQHRLNAKIMLRPVKWKEVEVWFTIIPYLNMNLNEAGAYNTPLNLEVNFHNWVFGIDTNFRQVQFQVRFREKLFSKKFR